MTGPAPGVAVQVRIIIAIAAKSGVWTFCAANLKFLCGKRV
jgi:hypothetical protein